MAFNHENQKVFVRLSVEAEAFWSGQTYYEEVFLPKEVWEEIKDQMEMEIYITGLDGKHSEVKGVINVDEFTEKELADYIQELEDGEHLFHHIYKYLDPKKYDGEYLLKIQEEVETLCKVEEIRIKIRKDQKDEVLVLLKDYLR